ncbi:hypothetical protein [Pseudomonas shahriarae]|uniref:hypothetical protein n=1 Tax=Pseudomonas shahriarae TaxID=2745512 RepID=UPI00249C099A|nr:hypothetical protein [Pseudomonas shahriarae]MDI3205409.1 hypothetical protein [Pseudomonas shahriarae]
MSKSLREDISLNVEGMGQPNFNMPEAKIGLAKLVLFFLFVLVAIAISTIYIPDEMLSDRDIKLIDNVYQSIVPIASMVIGYYFAKD